MKLRQQIFRWTLICVALWLALCVAIGIVSVEGALHPPRRPIDANEESSTRAVAAIHRAAVASASILAADGSTLRGWTFTPAAGNGNAVILLHGQADNRAGMLAPAGVLLDHGYAVLLPDARAHGASGGAIATYGVLESADIRQWVNWLQQSQSPHCVYGLGDSMGGADLLQSLSWVPDFCAVVAESAFSTFREAAYDRVGQAFSTGPWLGRTALRPAVEAGLLYARLRYKVGLSHASPERAVASSRVPILLIHGLADDNIPPRHSERMHAANPATVLWEPQHAEHCGASTAEPEEYERRVIGWFESHSLR